MSKLKKVLITVAVAIVVLAVAAYLGSDWLRKQFFKPTDSSITTGITSEREDKTKIIARNLTVPWGLAFLPDGDVLVTERSGTLRRIENGQTHKIDGVRHVGEGGLLGLALHPDFEQNRWLYLYLTTENSNGLTNRIERYTYKDDKLAEKTPILEGIPGAQYHDGGRIVFGPDGYLYVTTGDAGKDNDAQDTNSLAGKVLRVNESGGVPDDNPFGNEVYSYGHRNPQGLAWDDQGRLWQTEHGRSGLQTGYDELNLISKGANYGWPLIQGDEKRDGMRTPIAHSGPDETWAPASLAYSDGSLFFGGLRGESLYEAKLTNGNQVELKAHFREDYGRLRTVVFGPGGQLYMTTSNTDGRGNEMPGDDKIIRVNPAIF